jgi:hypothetical protein
MQMTMGAGTRNMHTRLQTLVLIYTLGICLPFPLE